MQKTKPVSYKGYFYISLFYLLQAWYSANYDKLPARLESHKKAFNPYVLNYRRPLVSTSDAPYHALKYAYGVKLYEGHKHERLRPRWRENGKAERPYSGKVYVSLHPLTDYKRRRTSHVTSCFKHGLLRLGNTIAAERETSFLGFLPKSRVFEQHIAKYPSFVGPYKSCFDKKYGLSKAMYEGIQDAIKSTKPHSEKRKQLKHTLGEYFCAYQEVCLVDLAYHEAKKRNQVLIYRNEDGQFSLYAPDTPSTANKRLNAFMKKRKSFFEVLAPDKREVITLMDRQATIKKMQKLAENEPINRGLDVLITR